jgi:hypothetical protein
MSGEARAGSHARVPANGRPQGEESGAKARTTSRSGLLADRTRAVSGVPTVSVD